MRRNTVGILTLACFASSSAAGADTQAGGTTTAPTIELNWSGPGPERQCMGGPALEREVNAYLRREAITEPPGELALSVLVQERPGRQWSATIYLRDQREGRVIGERELVVDGPLCSSLDEPLKLAVALLVDADLLPPESAAPPTPQPSNPPPAPEDEQQPEDESEEGALPTGVPEFDAPAPHRSRVGLELAALAGSTALPELGVGAQLGLHWSALRWLALRAHVAAFAPQTVTLGADAEVRSSLWYSGASICPRAFVNEGLHLLGCAALEGGSLSLSSRGLESGFRSRRAVWLASLGGRVQWQLVDSLALFGQLSVAWPLLRQRFWYEEVGKRQDLFSLSAPTAALGVGLTLWLN
ncbi:MAG TPA: hypothetical protein VFQ61_17140 [Polyangiaceae bacterium]|nr:hypothetical protein [Polyangiaceae bacterium]